MRTHLEFRAPAFKGGPNSINPEIDGSKLADFLDARFQELGYDGGVGEEDWGWSVELRSAPFRTWLGCASYDDDNDGWLVFIEPSKPFVRRWFRKLDARPIVDEVASHLERVLVDGGATDLRWWSDEDSGRR